MLSFNLLHVLSPNLIKKPSTAYLFRFSQIITNVKWMEAHCWRPVDKRSLTIIRGTMGGGGGVLPRRGGSSSRLSSAIFVFFFRMAFFISASHSCFFVTLGEDLYRYEYYWVLFFESFCFTDTVYQLEPLKLKRSTCCLN